MSDTSADSVEAGEAYLRGIELFNSGQFFEAHEVWEDPWRATTGPHRAFLQGLIQCAVALEHLRRGNARGAVRLSQRYPAKFSGLPAIYMGVDIAQLLADMHRTLGHLRETGSANPPDLEQPSQWPTIQLSGIWTSRL